MQESLQDCFAKVLDAVTESNENTLKQLLRDISNTHGVHLQRNASHLLVGQKTVEWLPNKDFAKRAANAVIIEKHNTPGMHLKGR